MIIERDIPFGVSRELDKQETQEILLVFLTIWTPALSAAITVVSDPENFVLGGVEYQGFEFDIKLLNDSDGMPQATLTVQNVDQRMSDAVINATDPVRLNIEVIAASEFDLTVFPRTEIGTAERVYSAKYLYLTEVTGDILQLTGTIRSWDYIQESWPALRATQKRFPGLYWS